MKNKKSSITQVFDSGGIPISVIEEIEDVCVHIVDSDGKTICYSRGCEIVENMSKDEIINKKPDEVYQFLENESMQLKVLKTGKKVIASHVKYETLSGKVADVMSSTYPIFSKEDPKRVEATICIFKDIPNYMEMANTISKLQEDLKSQQFLNNGTQFIFEDIIGSSHKMKQCIQQAKLASENKASVLISGATGTGKEVFAQSIHNAGSYVNSPFIAINCGAIPENLLESTLFGTTKGAFTGAMDTKGLIAAANGGTLFLDELNSMNLTLQSKLLRVLETEKYRRVGSDVELKANIRVISALNQEPLKAIAEKRLRSDLYYRLAVFSIELPSLKERKSDILELSSKLLLLQAAAMGKRLCEISYEAKEILYNHDWPGNIRELKHVITLALHRSQYLDTVLTPKLLPDYLIKNHEKSRLIDKYLEPDESEKTLKNIMKKVEKDVILEVLRMNNFNITKSAKSLGLSRQSLQYRMKMYDIYRNDSCNA